VAVHRVVLAGPDRAGVGIHGHDLRIAVSIGIDLRLGAGAVHEWIVGRDASVVVEANNLSVVIAEILRKRFRRRITRRVCRSNARRRKMWKIPWGLYPRVVNRASQYSRTVNAVLEVLGRGETGTLNDCGTSDHDTTGTIIATLTAPADNDFARS